MDRKGDYLLYERQYFLEPVKVFFIFRTGKFFNFKTLLIRSKYHAKCDFALMVIDPFKADLHVKIGLGQPCPAYAFHRLHIFEYTFVLIVSFFRAVHSELPMPAFTQVKLMNCV